MNKFLFIIIFIILIPIAYSATYTCDSCSACNGNITSAAVGDTIELTADITSSGTCIQLSNSVDFDCKTHSITGNGNNADVYISSQNSTVSNCYLTSAEYGVYVNDATGNITINNITAINNSIAGIYIYDGSNIIVNNSDLIDNTGQGLYFGDSDQSNSKTYTISNTVAGSGSGKPIYYAFDQTGLNIDGSVYSTLFLVNVNNSQFTNFDLSSGGGVILYSNYNNFSSITTNDNWLGLKVLYSDYNIFSSITANNNKYGIDVLNSDSNQLLQITTNNNQADAIKLTSSSNNNITSCESNNNANGIALTSATFNIIRECSIQYNTNGITYGSTVQNNIITDNTITDNTYNIYFQSFMASIQSNFHYNNTLGNISKISSDDWTSIGTNYFNLSNVGNTYYNDTAFTGTYCFDGSNANNCDYFANATTFPVAPVASSVSKSSIYPLGELTIGIISIILFFISF